MLDFGVFDKELAAKETRLVYPNPESGLPGGPFAFREFYCNEPRCDCRRVLLLVYDANGTAVAGLNYQFEPPRPGDPEPSQLEIDPLNPQSRHSEGLRDLLWWMVTTDRAYHDRLVRHYTLFKAAVDDPRHPRHAAVRSAAHDDPDHRPAFPARPPPKQRKSRTRKGDSPAPNAPWLFVFSLGPIPTDEGEGWIYVGRLDGQLLSPPPASTPSEALRLLRAQAPSGARLECSPDLAKAGARLGFKGVPLPEPLVALRAELALLLSAGPSLAALQPELRPLLEAAGAFWESEIWQRLPPNLPLTVTLTGAVSATYEAALMGAGGEEFGLVLYPVPGSMATIQKAVARGRFDIVMQLDSLTLSLEEEPEFACDAIEAWCGMPCVPSILAMQGGAPRAVTTQDGRALAVTLHALANWTEAPMGEAQSTLAIDSEQVSVTVRLALPAPASKGRTRKKRG